MSDFFSSYFGLQGYVIGILFVGIFICGGVCLILRPLILWYFKLYSIVDELKTNNELLREIHDELIKMNSQTHPAEQPKEDYSRYMPK